MSAPALVAAFDEEVDRMLAGKSFHGCTDNTCIGRELGASDLVAFTGKTELSCIFSSRELLEKFSAKAIDLGRSICALGFFLFGERLVIKDRTGIFLDGLLRNTVGEDMDLTAHVAVIKLNDTLHFRSGMISEIVVLKSKNRTVRDLCDALVKRRSFRDRCAVSKDTGHLRIGDTVRIENILEALGCHLGLCECAVFVQRELVSAADTAHDGTVCHLVIENVPLVADFADGTVIISARVVASGIYECALIFKRTRRGIRYCVDQLACGLCGRIDHVVLAVDLSWRTSLEEVKRRGIRDDIHLERSVDHFVHVIRVYLEHVGTQEAAIYIYTSVIINERARIDEDASVRVVLDIVLIAGKNLKWSFRLVRYGDAAERILDVSVKIIFAVLFDYVRSKQTSVRPVGIGRMTRKISCGKSDAVGCPVRRITDRCGPGEDN